MESVGGAPVPRQTMAGKSRNDTWASISSIHGNHGNRNDFKRRIFHCYCEITGG